MARILKTRHFRKRQQQRGLPEDVLDFILDFAHAEKGENTWGGWPAQKRGRAVWYYVQRRHLPTYLRGSWIAEEAERWLVILTEDETVAMTTYPADKPSRHIRRRCVKRHARLRRRRRRVSMYQHLGRFCYYQRSNAASSGAALRTRMG